MARKKKTHLYDIDDAMRVLNSARITFRPDHLPVEIEADGSIFCEWMGPCSDLPPEMENAINLTLEAGHMTFGIVGEGAELKVIEDHRGRWVLIPND